MRPRSDRGSSPTRRTGKRWLSARATSSAGRHIPAKRRRPQPASAPEHSAGIELAIERFDDGEVSPFFHDVAQIGDTIELRGPIGGPFVWEVGPLLLFGGGSGVVPLMSML
ncbi:MAG TPA: FAD-binding oxidoreductase, partial [Methyloceanibacter sp.]|nr:FAD-binding oxidoreductase [Methyloceanibacter sp.]